ncbi:MAG TPA: serine/threonine-protein kinase [Streptosporangiaceae bacterium]|nr:serine/threonine-protein kinase [Streptosporangiaceae bacterium]
MTQDIPAAPGGFGPGSRIAGYLLEEQIGQGGMAVVFRAHDERLDRTVALKILAPALAADEAFRQRFIRESRAAAAVDDPHIIPVFEAGEAGGVLFIAMRYVRGGDVKSMAGELGPLPPGRVVEITRQVASALDAAHARGLVHRDVKPANMLLDSRAVIGRPDHIYLSDFGLSKAALQATGLTGTGTFLGTLDYISPEQIEGKPVDGRADEYALACAAFELITGRPPFQRDDAMAIMYAQLSEPAPPVTSRRPDVPYAVNDVFARALAKAPSDRYPTCTDFADALRDAFGIRPYDSGEGSIPSGPHPATQLVAQGGQEGSTRPGVPTGAPGPGQGGYGQGGSGGRGGYPGTDAGAPGGQPTQLAGGGSGSDGNTSPDLAAANWQPRQPGGGGYGAADYGSGRGRRRFSPLAIAAVIVLILVLAGGGGYLALHHKGSGGDSSHLPPLSMPGCTAHAAKGRNLSVPNKLNTINSTGSNPFGLQVTQDSKYVFAVTPTAVQVLARGPGLVLTPKFTYTIANTMGASGATMTHNGKYLLVAAGAGIDVLSVANAVAGAESIDVGTLLVPHVSGNSGAVEVEVSPDDKFAFVTLKSRNVLAVFNLAKALATNSFGSATYVGSVHLGANPVGLAMSPDGKYLYVTSYARGNASGSKDGLLNVLSLPRLETDPEASVLAQVDAGCMPARVVAAPDGKTVWVTARGSNAVLGFSASAAAADSKHSLIAKVLVGQTPIGLTLVNNGSRLVVADTDIEKTQATGNLAVVSVSAALARKPALLGYIPSGMLPREFAIVPGGRYLLVSDNGSAQVQVVDLSKLP